MGVVYNALRKILLQVKYKFDIVYIYTVECETLSSHVGCFRLIYQTICHFGGKKYIF